MRFGIFPRKGIAKDSYLEYIPITWIACNNLTGGPLSTEILETMIRISILNYQADEYMEIIVKEQYRYILQEVKGIIRRMCKPVSFVSTVVPQKRHRNEESQNGFHKTVNERGGDNAGSLTLELDEVDLREVEHVLSIFVKHVMNIQPLQMASIKIRQVLCRELANFLLAHVVQCEDNIRLKLDNGNQSNRDGGGANTKEDSSHHHPA